MRKLLYIISVALILGLAGGCDRKGAELDRTFDRADALMTDHPDSALAIMQTVDTTGLSRARLARYALLLTKAEAKYYDEPPFDPRIKIALDYYKGRNNSDELQALYYYANVKYLNRNHKEALPYMHMANDLSKALNDKFYEGLSARVLADLYRNFCKYDEELKYCLEAQKAHNDYDSICKRRDLGYGSWLDIMLAEAYNDLRQPEKALHISSHPDTSWYNEDEYFRHETIKNRAKSYQLLGEFQKVVDCYDELSHNNYRFKGYDWCVRSHNSFIAGDKQKAYIYLDSARQYVNDRYTATYVKMLTGYYLADKGDFKQAYEAARDWEHALQIATDTLLTSSTVTGAIELYRSQSQNRSLQLEIQRRHNMAAIVIAVLVLILLSLVIVALRNKIKARKAEIALLQQQKDEYERNEKALTDSVASLVAESRILEENLKLKNETEERLNNELRKFIENKADHLQNAYRVMLKCRNSQSKSDKSTDSLFRHIAKDDALASLDHFIDICSPGFTENIRLHCPSLSLRQLRFVRYIRIGFSPELIMAIINLPTPESYRVMKHRIKTAIIKEAGDKTDEILRSLGMI